MMSEEVGLIESGGATDFHYATYRQFHFDPVKVDRVLHDGEMLRLGDVTLTAFLTPGHTRGSTTFVARVQDGRTGYTVIFPSGTTINPGYRLSRNPSYPRIAADYRRTFQVLETLRPDIWLGDHTETFDFEGKRARAVHQGVVAWIDPRGYETAIAEDREKFEAALRDELDSPAATTGR
jgi:metallo-beta-lactamase class B